MKVFFALIFIHFSSIFALSTYGQKWESNKVSQNDTIIETRLYLDEQGNHAEDTTGTHKIVYHIVNYNVVRMARFSKEGQPSEDHRGIHRKDKFWKFYKYFDKNNQQVLTVKEPYYYEQGNATYRILTFDEIGNLIEVAYFKDEVVFSEVEQVIVRNRIKAVEAYKGMTHKFIYSHSKGSKVLKEYLYDMNDKLQEQRRLVMKKPKVKKVKKKNNHFKF